MYGLVVKWLMDYSGPWSTADGQPNHGCDVVEMALDKTLRAIQRINPYDHVFLVKLIRKFKKVPGCLRSLGLVYRLNFVEILSIAMLMNIIVV
jgi:hypothetical protein